jgi:hypothetical protein
MSWLISKALMNLLCSQEQVEESLEENSLDGTQSALLNGNPIQQAYCAPDKMTDFSRLSRFGMMYKPLMENRGEELLTLYLAGSHAKTFQQQEKAQELTESDQECGEKWRGSFVKWDQNSFSWKTHQCSLLGDLEPFSETWPQWGLMRGGECWEQRTLEQTIRGTESGLSEQTWPTPDANCGRRGTQPNWTPKRKSGQPAQYTINQAVRDKMFPTPTSHNSKEGAYPAEYNRKTPSLATHAGGKLNPTWVEWLMGWPLEWTDLKPLEMDKSHCVQQQHGEF